VTTSGSTAVRAAGPALLLLTGVVVLRLTLGGAYTDYVRPGMVWLLLPAGLLLSGLGAAGLWRVVAPAAEDDVDAAVGDDEHEHAHHGVPGISALLLLPLVVAYAVAPPALGAFSAERAAGAELAPSRDGYAELAVGGDGVADAALSDVVRRAAWDGERALGSTPVRVTGFVVPDEGTGRVLLTRFVIRCCAADGTPAQLDVTLPPGTPPLPADAWLEAVVRYDGPGPDGSGPARFTADSVREVAPPADPYES
jgi:uncharacterized repeat protein (TIGR03943 family)